MIQPSAFRLSPADLPGSAGDAVPYRSYTTPRDTIQHPDFKAKIAPCAPPSALIKPALLTTD